MQVCFRKTQTADVDLMHQVVNEYAAQGLMLPGPAVSFIDPRRENPGIHAGDERRTNV